MTKTDRVSQVIGEIILISPLVIACLFLRMGLIVALAMPIIFVCKQFYESTAHIPKGKDHYCIIITCGVFLGLGIFYRGFQTLAFMQNQPMIIVLCAVGISWINANIGDYQREHIELLTEREQRQHSPRFDPDHCTEEELIARCREVFTRDVVYKTEKAIQHFILKLPHEQIDINPRTSQKQRERMRKSLRI